MIKNYRDLIEMVANIHSRDPSLSNSSLDQRIMNSSLNLFSSSLGG